MEHDFELARDSKYSAVELKSKNYSSVRFVGTIKAPTESGKEKVVERITLTIMVDPSRIEKYQDLFDLEREQVIVVRTGDSDQTELSEFDK